MQTVSYAATRYGYCVQVLDGGQVVYEYSAGNCWKESPDRHRPQFSPCRPTTPIAMLG